MKRKITDVIVHCSATQTGTVESIRRYHVDINGWKDIGYHYVIELDGSVKIGRNEDQVGSHCVGANSNSIGICLVGDKEFSDEQRKSLYELLCDIIKRHNLGVHQISGHKDWPSAKKQGKTCPNIPTGEIHAQVRALIGNDEIDGTVSDNINSVFEIIESFITTECPQNSERKAALRFIQQAKEAVFMCFKK